MDFRIVNCHVVSPGYDCPKGWIEVSGDKIRDFGSGEPAGSFDGKVFDGTGLIVAPGFFDIHFHGRSNSDFCDGTVQALETIGRGKLEDGVTHMLATTMTVSEDCLRDVARSCAEYSKTQKGRLPHIPGVHMEGPFFNADCVGAQNPEFLKTFDLGFVDEMNSIYPVSKVSFSPELEGGVEFTRGLVERGIVASAGHSSADYQQFCAVRDAGLTHLTHFCNVMTPVHHLRFGMVGGGLLSDSVYVEMICDGVHLLDEMIDLIVRLKGLDKVMIITDSMRAAGMPDGDYTLGGQKVLVRNRRATLVNGVVAGGVGLYHEGLQRMARVTKKPLCEVIKATGWNQAKSLHLDGVGKLQQGWGANLAVLDDGLNPVMTFVDGELAWQK